MATALHPPRPEMSGLGQLQPYSRNLPMAELDLKDNRYPALSPATSNRRTSTLMIGQSSGPSRDIRPRATEATQRSRPDAPAAAALSAWSPQNLRDGDSGVVAEGDIFMKEDVSSQQPPPQLSQQTKHESVVSYALPPGAQPARRVIERYSLDDDSQPLPSSGVDIRQVDAPQGVQQEIMMESPSWPKAQYTTALPNSFPIAPSTSRPPPLPPGAAAANGSPMVPQLYNPVTGISIPVSPKPRIYAQQPTYVTPPTAPNPMKPTYSPKPMVQEEEVCVECAMRDQDMADVDVTTPGVWDRESDVLYHDLIQREQDEEAAAVVSSDVHNKPARPRSKGGRLTESNLKVWLTMNPREPASRQQTLETYIKSQRLLLEAEAVAHSRAMQESQQLDNKMRDAYSQLRRSAYDMGASAAPVDDSGGVRIKSPTPHARSHSREVTLLENGMIVEHVDVRREEREERERKRKEEKRERSRVRKNSQSGADVMSVYSVNSTMALNDSGVGLRPQSRYSQAGVVRPTSVLTAPPLDRPPGLPRAHSQASFSDVHSLGSASPRARFFGIKNISSGWRSQDSLAQSGISGSMMDMHVALQHEAYQQQTYPPIDTRSQSLSARRSQVWPQPEIQPEETRSETHEKPKKKKSGLSKMWRIVTGTKKVPQTTCRVVSENHNDNLPLAPPPPLSYLVERGPAGDFSLSSGRHASTPSVPSTPSPKAILSTTEPSSILPSPTSSRPSGGEQDPIGNVQQPNGNHENEESEAVEEPSNPPPTNSVVSEPDVRQGVPQNSQGTVHSQPESISQSPASARPASVLGREKSLPPLPDELRLRPVMGQPDGRPRTVYTYDPRPISHGPNPQPQGFLHPQAPFRTPDTRRQSLGGITSGPNLSSQTMPVQPGYPNGYDEFARSNRSLGPFQEIQTPSVPQTPSKRRSKFGFTSFLIKKSPAIERELLSSPATTGTMEFPTLRNSTCDGREDVGSNGGYGTSVSRHSAFSAGPRISLSSRRAIEELVAQEPEFVAYRYPSNDQRLDLLRSPRIG